MKKKASLKDIAKELGVSVATVSYVLTEKKDSRVSPAMAKKVKEVAKRLNYQPNTVAQSLKTGSTNTIGLILADISNPFFANIARVIEDEAAKSNYTVIFGSSDEKASKSKQLIDFLSSRQVDGFIIAPSEGGEEHLRLLQKQGMPVVLIDRFFPEVFSDQVMIDNFKASFDLVEELVKSGHKNIGMLAYGNSLHHMQERVRGYQSVLKKYDLKSTPDKLGHIPYENILFEVESAIDKMLASKEPIDSIFFATNTLAIRGLKYFHKLNIKVPDDVAVVSFDQGEAFDFYYCPLTHVRQPLEKMAKNAVHCLIDRIENPSLPNKTICLEAEVVVQESSAKTH
ncbi:LacI family DNA-binding transcriptional regulator [Flavobacteriaceae bacterium GF1]